MAETAKTTTVATGSAGVSAFAGAYLSQRLGLGPELTAAVMSLLTVMGHKLVLWAVKKAA